VKELVYPPTLSRQNGGFNELIIKHNPTYPASLRGLMKIINCAEWNRGLLRWEHLFLILRIKSIMARL